MSLPCRGCGQPVPRTGTRGPAPQWCSYRCSRGKGPRPTSVPCRYCDGEIPVQPTGPLPERCQGCRRALKAAQGRERRRRATAL